MAKAITMLEPVAPAITIPDHVSVLSDSPAFWPNYRKLNVVFNGVERKNDVQEFCVSQGWIRVEMHTPQGRVKRERGKAVTIMLRGKVEVSLRE